MQSMQYTVCSQYSIFIKVIKKKRVKTMSLKNTKQSMICPILHSVMYKNKIPQTYEENEFSTKTRFSQELNSFAVL